jgi:hypothetical protein
VVGRGGVGLDVGLRMQQQQRQGCNVGGVESWRGGMCSNYGEGREAQGSRGANCQPPTSNLFFFHFALYLMTECGEGGGGVPKCGRECKRCWQSRGVHTTAAPEPRSSGPPSGTVIVGSNGGWVGGCV